MTTTTMSRASINWPVFLAALALSGCWTAPVANVQPKGAPRLIQSAIAVESVKNPTIVQSTDGATRTIVLQISSTAAASAYKAAPEVENFDQIKAGDRVKARVTEELAIYVLRDGQLPGTGGAPETIATNAKVLSVDPSYRLLRVQHPHGLNETFKVGREVRLELMEAGDDVVIRPVEALRVRKR